MHYRANLPFCKIIFYYHFVSNCLPFPFRASVLTKGFLQILYSDFLPSLPESLGTFLNTHLLDGRFAHSPQFIL